MVTAGAVAATLLSALALYAGSGHCQARRLRRLRGIGTVAGVLLATVALCAWILLLGPGAGLCVMLATWMAGLMAAPWLGAMGAHREPTRRPG